MLRFAATTRDLRGVFLIVLSATGFGAMALFARGAAADGADVTGVLLARFWIAGLVLLAVARHRRLPRPPRTQRLALCAMGGIGYTGMSACYFAALDYAPTALVALLLYAYPTLVTLLAALFLKEPITARKAAALAACTAGTALTVGAGFGEMSSGVGTGAALALGAAAIYAAYITVGARAARGVDPIVTATTVCLSSALVLTVVGLLRAAAGMPPRFPASGLGWIDVLAVALLSTVVAVLAFFAGLARLGASRASMLSTLEPLVTIALGAALLSESLSGRQWIGGALTLSGVLLLAAGGAPREAAPNATA